MRRLKPNSDGVYTRLHVTTRVGDETAKLGSGRAASFTNWELLASGAVEIIDLEHLKTRISRGDRLRVKLGLDPTKPDIHLGHTVVLRKLQRFQEQGHQAVLIIGDTTAQIGDPSGQNATRPQLTREEVDRAAATYLDQMWKLLDREATEVRRQSEWFGTMGLADLVGLMSKYTVARMLAREDFARRLAENRPVALHELLYPLLQAYDSVAVRADLELGGTDQTFNLLVGRDMQEAFGQPPQDIMTAPLLEGLDGKQKMSKSLDNYIGIDEPPAVMFRKVMSIPDDLILKYWELATAASPQVLQKERDNLARGENPRDVKNRLAQAIVGQFHGTSHAASAASEFKRVIQDRGLPADIPAVTVTEGERRVVDLLVEVGLASSKSEARRLIEQRGVKVDGRDVTSPDERVTPHTGMRLQRGLHRVFELKVR